MTNKRLEFINARLKSWHILEGNYEDLCASCEDLANPTTEIKRHNIAWIMHEDTHIKMLDIERQFHNFLASAKTLVDHTRALMKNHSETLLYKEFEDRRQKIGNLPIIKLCHGLRNYFLHLKNPLDNYFIQQTWYESENTIVVRGFVRISKESLPKELTKVINHLEGPLDIRELADEYFKEVSEFNRWVDSEFSSHLGRA